MAIATRSAVGGLTQSALSALDGVERPVYLAIIDAAFLSEEPLYATRWFGDLFRQRARDPSWLASLLASDSYMEGYSAKRLWQYAATIQDPVLATSMRRHAKDEGKHSKIFAASVFKTFPSLEDPELLHSLLGNAPTLSDDSVYGEHLLSPPTADELLSSMLLVNLFEIKALMLGMLTKPVVLAHAPPENKLSLEKMFDSIIKDEAHHIGYTADFIEAACRSGQRDLVESSLREFQVTLNQVTATELERGPD